MLNPTGFRRFPFPHLSFLLDFCWNFRAEMRREGGLDLIYGGYPGRPRGGDRPPLSPGRRATGPCRARGRARPLVAPGGVTAHCRPLQGRHAPFFLQGSRCKFEEKNYTKRLSPYGRATGGIFEIIQNGHIFLKFLFF